MCELGIREDWLHGRKLDVSPNIYGLLVKWLRHLPFTQVARVQFSYRLPNPRLGYESYPSPKLSIIRPHPLIGLGVQTFNLAIGVRTSVGSPPFEAFVWIFQLEFKDKEEKTSPGEGYTLIWLRSSVG